MINKISHNQMSRSPWKTLGGFAGFTLIELLVGLVVTALVGTAIVGSYVFIVRLFTDEREVAVMQMNLRGSVEDMSLQFRMAGYDPRAEIARTIFGITDVRRYDITGENTAPANTPSGSPALTLIYDNYNQPGGADGVKDGNDIEISYRLFDDGSDGIFEMARDTKPFGGAITLPREILAENIQAVGFAYAIDNDGNGDLDLAAGGFTIWAIDSDNDNVLDTNLDANGDGSITEADDTDGNFLIDAADQSPNGALIGTVPLSSIRSVRIWLLARAEKTSKDYNNQEHYLVGDRILTAANGDFDKNLKCRLLMQTIQCRNLGTLQ